MYSGPISSPTGTTTTATSTLFRVPNGNVTVATPLAGSPRFASGVAYGAKEPIPDALPGFGLRYPFRNPRVLKVTSVVGGFVDLVLVAGVTLGGGRIVCASGGAMVYASSDDLSTIEGVTGITLNAAAMGANVNVRPGGEVSDSGWSWTSGQDLFLGLNGVMTHTPPTSGYVLCVGWAISATTIFVKFETPIELV